LCCDGLYNWIELSKINEIIDKETDFSKVADKLIELALKNGSNDNITTIVIKEI
jgi:serine/threonine protein phosphatase PrpC